MRRLTLEVPYQDFWRPIFGPVLKRVEIIEALRCLKCDAQGFSIICRIQLQGDMKVKDLLKHKALTSVETLYKEKDGSVVVHLEGKLPAPRNLPQDGLPKWVCDGPPEFVGADKIKIALLGTEKDLQNVLQRAEKQNFPLRILGLAPLEPRLKSHLSRLTSKQRRVLLTAYGLGYYDIPRRTSSEELARDLKVDTSTLLEHLRKAEKKILSGILAD